MPLYDAVKELQTELIRKATGGSAFIAPATADVITSLTQTTGTAPNQVIDLLAFPTGYEDGGLLTNDGMGWATETTSSDVESFQLTSPSRSDITSETSTLNVTLQETKLLTLGLYTGIDTSGVEAAAGTGEVQIKKPLRPSGRFYRVLGLAVDENEFGEIYVARFLPRAKVTGKGEQQYGKSDNAIQYPVTFTGYFDSAYGSSETFIFGGAGWEALLTQMGIDQAA